jgi:hypothetical protein
VDTGDLAVVDVEEALNLDVTHMAVVIFLSFEQD